METVPITTIPVAAILKTSLLTVIELSWYSVWPAISRDVIIFGVSVLIPLSPSLFKVIVAPPRVVGDAVAIDIASREKRSSTFQP